jgi:ABC-type branched-subunit amino acid transport system ATPase component
VTFGDPRQIANNAILAVPVLSYAVGRISVRQNLELALNRGRIRKSANVQLGIQDVLQLFPFMNERLNSAVDLLSGGEQQMIAISRALLLKPDLLIMDEPSTALIVPLCVRGQVRKCRIRFDDCKSYRG